MAERRENECSNCGAELEVDFSKETVQCPYCRTVYYVSDLIGDSDEVRISRINAKKDIEIEKGKRKIEEKRLIIEEKQHKERLEDEQIYRFKHSLTAHVYKLMAILSGFMILCAYISRLNMLMVVSISQLLIFIVAYLMGIRVIPEKFKNMRTVIAIIGFLLIIPSFLTMGPANENSMRDFNWDDIVLSDVLPEPESKYGEIEANEDNWLLLEIGKTNKTQFKEYVFKCKDKGFTIDVEEELDEFLGFTEDGYELTVRFDGTDGIMSIVVHKQVELKEMSWKESGIATKIPKPEYTKGTTKYDTVHLYEVYIDMNKEAYTSYVDTCVAAGFNVDYSRDAKEFSGKDADGYTLYVNYEGNNVVNIRIALEDE